MNNQELYDKVIKAYKSNDDNYFAAAARNWVEGADCAPFDNIKAKELFNQAKLACKAWRNQAIYGRSSKVRMMEYVRTIAGMDLNNPYIKAETPNEVKEAPEKEYHFFGVVPDKEPADMPIQTSASAPAEEHVEKTNHPDQRRFFGKKNKR